ncbi:MAG: aspartate kinase, partial [Clostridia bacterium]|nr:aspartate kinase [Clostridia bacterium]
MSITVVKFGGTSMADAKAITQVANIIKQDPKRRYVVVSAPGKRFSQDHKITDMLYACYHDLQINGECSSTFAKIRDRFKGIVADLKLDLDINSYLDKVESYLLRYN